MENATPVSAEHAAELLSRLAALVCEGEEASVEDVRDGLAAAIDQTLLDPLAGPERVAAWARDNADEGFATLCVQPCNAARVAWELSELASPTRACTVLSFPQGQASPEEICFQVALMLAAGVAEIDLVMNVGAFLEGSYEDVAAPIVAALQTIDADDEEDAEGECCACGDPSCDGTCGDVWCECDDEGVCACGDPSCDGGCGCDDDCVCDGDCDDPDCACHHHGYSSEHHHEDAPTLKVILETGHLTPEQVCAATDLVSSLGVDFVKTSTGFGPRGATVEDVRLMCATVEPGVQVKASGGICTLEDALALLEAGATRLGTSRGKEILAEFDALAAALSV